LGPGLPLAYNLLDAVTLNSGATNELYLVRAPLFHYSLQVDFPFRRSTSFGSGLYVLALRILLRPRFRVAVPAA